MAIYYVKKAGKKFEILEESKFTVHIMKKVNDHTEAKKLAKHWNNGAGFAGYTPNFMFNGRAAKKQQKKS